MSRHGDNSNVAAVKCESLSLASLAPNVVAVKCESPSLASITPNVDDVKCESPSLASITPNVDDVKCDSPSLTSIHEFAISKLPTTENNNLNGEWNEIQTYLNTIKVTENDPGVLISFSEQGLAEFCRIGMQQNVHINRPSRVLQLHLDYPNFGPAAMVNAIRSCLSELADGYIQTQTMTAIMPMDLEQFCRVSQELVTLIMEPWFQQILGMMNYCGLGFIGTLTTNSLRSLQPLQIRVPNYMLNPLQPLTADKN